MTESKACWYRHSRFKPVKLHFQYFKRDTLYINQIKYGPVDPCELTCSVGMFTVKRREFPIKYVTIGIYQINSMYYNTSDTDNNHITDMPSPWNSKLLRAALLCEEFCEDILLGTFCKTYENINDSKDGFLNFF